MTLAMFCSDLVSCDVECGNFHQAESCKKCVENESPMIKRLMPYSWCGGECKWEPVMGLCIGKHTKFMIVRIIHQPQLNPQHSYKIAFDIINFR